MSPLTDNAGEGEQVLALERLLTAVLHDLRTPLVTIQGFVAGLESAARAGKWEQYTADTQRIFRTCERMRRLLNQLRLFLAADGPLEPREAVPLADLFPEVIEQVAGLQPPELTWVWPDEWPTLHGNQVALLQVFQNVLENAYRALQSQPAPSIAIQATTSQGRAHIVITDNGSGFDPANPPILSRSAMSAHGPNLQEGLGLSIVERIVSAHGGTLTLTSPGLGQGATVEIIWPLASGHTPPAN